MSSARDPKGYYACLDVPHTASPQTIKAAYRRLAKELHPDHNHGPTAQEDFQRLSEAYQVLSDPGRRRIYDVRAQGGPAGQARRNAGHGANQGAAGGQGHPGARTSWANGQQANAHQANAQQGTAQGRAQAAYHQANRRAGQGAATASQATAAYGARTQSPKGPFDPPEPCQCCGKIAAQPRYVVFPTVRGRGFKSLRGTVEGVFCRTCADNTALRVVWKNWLFGWWSLPFGPFHTLHALLTIARGGFMPRDRNFLLLLKQARAFLMRDQQALAHGLAVQANGYADSVQEKSLVSGLLKAAPAVRGLKLRNKWLGLSWARAGQAVPPLFALGLLAVAANELSALRLWQDQTIPTSVAAPEIDPPEALRSVLDEGLDRPMLLRTGRIYEVTTPFLPLRTGPGTGYNKRAELEIGTSVLVTENAPEGGWVRVLTAEGLSGFVAGRYLTPGLPERNLDDSFSTPETAPQGTPLTPPQGDPSFTVPPHSSVTPPGGRATVRDASTLDRRPPPLRPGVGLFSSQPLRD
jgi:uncharacterized protein YraI